MKKVLGIIFVASLAITSCKTEKTATSKTTTNKTEEATKSKATECDKLITYTATVKPIMEESCVKCHSGANPKHGIDLTTYENVVKATGHNLFCTVSGGGNCPKMPPFGPKLTEEQVGKIDCWIKNGMIE